MYDASSKADKVKLTVSWIPSKGEECEGVNGLVLGDYNFMSNFMLNLCGFSLLRQRVC